MSDILPPVKMLFSSLEVAAHRLRTAVVCVFSKHLLTSRWSTYPTPLSHPSILLLLLSQAMSVLTSPTELSIQS